MSTAAKSLLLQMYFCIPEFTILSLLTPCQSVTFKDGGTATWECSWVEGGAGGPLMVSSDNKNVILFVLNLFTIFKSSSDTLDGLPSADSRGGVEAKWNESFKKGWLHAKHVFDTPKFHPSTPRSYFRVICMLIDLKKRLMETSELFENRQINYQNFKN